MGAETEQLHFLQEILDLPDKPPVSTWDVSNKHEFKTRVRRILADTISKEFPPISDKELDALWKKVKRERKKLLGSKVAFSISGPSFQFALQVDGTLVQRVHSFGTLSTKILRALLSQYDRIRLCQKQGCNRLFVRTKRQVFCSERCANRVRLHRHRDKMKGEVAH